MSFMPFQILGIWLRGLLSLILLAGAVYLLTQWYNHRYIYVPETAQNVPVESQPDEGDPSERLPREQPQPIEKDTFRVVPWQFGLNRETAFLLSGLALTVWSLGGWSGRRLLRRRGSDEPKQMPSGEVQRLRRPDGTELYVEMYGPADGTPIVLTHGWGLDSNEWYYTKKKLTQRHRLIVWDLPGLGQSTRPTNNDWSLERLADDLDAVLALAGGRPAVLLGHSIGGMITLTYCRRFPQALGSRVQALVIVHSTYTNPVKTTSKATLYTALQKPMLEPLCHLMVWLAPLVWLMNVLSYLNGSAHRSTEKSSFSGYETRGQLDFLTRYNAKSWPGVIARGMLAMFRYDASDTLAAIPVPTLIVTSDEDRTCSPEASEYMAKTIPNARLVTLRPAKHCGLFEHHQQFDTLVGEFVSTTAS